VTAAPAPGPGARARRGRWVVLLLGAAGLVGLVSVPTWVHGEGRSVLEGTVAVAVPGSQAAPQAPAAALVLLAAAGALALVGRVGRWVVAGVSAAAGVLVVAGAVGVLRDPAGAVAAAVADATGVAAADPVASATAWPVVALVVGAAVPVLAVVLARAPGGWDQRSQRHERPAPGRAGRNASGAADERSDWDALSRGDDPS